MRNDFEIETITNYYSKLLKHYPKEKRGWTGASLGPGIHTPWARRMKLK